MSLQPTHATLLNLLTNIVGDIDILAGDDIGPNGAAWQDVAGTLACNMRVYANLLDQLREGRVPAGGVSFPSLGELVGDNY